MNFSAAVRAGQVGELADELADVGHDQALHDRVERQGRRRLGQHHARLRAQGGHRWSSRRRPSTVSVRWTEASSWQRWHVMSGPSGRGVGRQRPCSCSIDLILSRTRAAVS